jgi:predicted ATPase/DNA-binding SARP family transcriptional activator
VLRVALLGPVTVESDGQPVDLRRTLELALLARLALSPGIMVPNDRLFEDLWAERQPANPLGNLQSLVYRLRRALGPEGKALMREGNGYRLVIPADRVDATRFRDLVARARAGPGDEGPVARRALLTAALDLWRGTPLANIEAVPFVDAQRVRLEAAYLMALEERVDADLDCGAHREVVSELEGLVVDHPFRERFWAQLVTALYRSGSQTAALRACTKLRELLREQLGVDPSPMVRSLEEAVLRQDPVLSWPGPGREPLRGEDGPISAEASVAHDETVAPADQAHADQARADHDSRLPRAEIKATANLPLALSRFIGRAEELAIVQKLVADNRLVTLTGPGGVGKTRLAVEVAYRARGQYPDGVWLVDLAPLRDPDLVPQTIAAALGVPSSPDRSAIDSLFEFVGGRHLMLVLDNCEHVVGQVAEVAVDLLGRAPQLVAVATSREPLHLDGEVVWRVPVLSLPPGEGGAGLEGAFSCDAVRLFVDRALSARPQLTIGEADTPALVGIVQRLDGLPLAIELAATRLGALGLPDLVSRLSQRLELLNKGFRGAPDRHQTLVATLDWSYQLLEVKAQLAFRYLSSFGTSFTLEAATAVLGDDMAPGPTFDVLCDLVDKSLVVLVDTGGESRYRFLETVREYATGLLESWSEGHEARRRLLLWSVALAEESAGALLGPRASVWLERLELELDNLRAALRWAENGGSVELGLRLCTGLVWFWTGRGHAAEGQAWLQRLLGAPEVVAGPVRALALATSAELASEQGSNAQAVELSDRAVAVGREAGDLVSLGWALLSSGNALFRAGRFSEARTHLDETLAVAEKTGMRPLLEMTQFVLFQLEYETDNTAAVMKRTDWSITSSRTSGNLRLLTNALLYRGEIKEQAGDYTASMGLFQEALSCAREFGDVSFVAGCLQTVGFCLFQQGEFEQARAYFEDSLASGDASQPEARFAHSLMALSELNFELGDYGSARTLLDDALVLMAPDDDSGSRRYGMLLAANLAGAQGDPLAALGFRRQALYATLSRRGVIQCLEALACSLDDYGEDHQGVVLLASAGKSRRDIGWVIPLYRRQRHAQLLEELEDDLGETAFDHAWAEGEAVPIEEAKTRALDVAAALLETNS